MRFLICPALAAWSLALAVPAMAGAWTDDPGHGEVITTLRGSVADRQFDADGNLSAAPRFTKQEFDVYFTYGLMEGTSLIFHPTVMRMDNGGVFEFGLDRTQIGIKQLLWNSKDSVLSLQGSVLVPGSTASLSGWGGEIRGLYGWNFTIAGKPAYGNFELAYRAFEGAQEIRPELTLGWHVNDSWQLIVQSLTTISIADADEWWPHRSKLQASAARKLSDRLTLQFGVGATVWGENAAAERYGFTGLWWKL